MKTISQQLKKSLRWTSIEALLYQSILFAHQILLFQKVSQQTYGQISVIFSLIFLAITLVSFGLDTSISPFFNIIKQSKKNFKAFFLTHIVSHFFISILFSIIFTKVAAIFFPYIFSTNKILFLLMPLIIVTQSFYKITKSFLYLFLQNKIVAFLQSGCIIFYVSCIWIPYIYGFHISPITTLIPMALISIAPSIIALFFIYSFYKKLSKHDISIELKHFQKKIILSRFFTYLTQINKLLFSNNFLIPIAALHFGQTQAGVFKLMSHVARYISSLFSSIFGNISQSLFGITKNMEYQIKEKVFASLFNKLINIFYILVIFSFINYNKILNLYTKTISLPIKYCFLFLFIIVSENIITIYEKWLVNEEKSHFVFNINALFSITTIGIIGLLKKNYHISSLSEILSIIFVIRILTYLLIIEIAKINQKKYTIIRFDYMAAALCFSGIFFILV